MQTLLDYIMSNYIWIIAGSIIILLAIIGYYADKTNFGQGKTQEKDSNDNVDIKSLEGKRMEDLLEHNEGMVNNSEINTESDDISIHNNQMDSTMPNNNLQNDTVSVESKNFLTESNQINSLNESEENFEKFNKEFNELLPKKEIIDDELLDEIENLSFDKTQKIDLSDIQDLDDVELPTIKPLKTEEEDIWKF